MDSLGQPSVEEIDAFERLVTKKYEMLRAEAIPAGARRLVLASLQSDPDGADEIRPTDIRASWHPLLRDELAKLDAKANGTRSVTDAAKILIFTELLKNRVVDLSAIRSLMRSRHKEAGYRAVSRVKARLLPMCYLDPPEDTTL